MLVAVEPGKLRVCLTGKVYPDETTGEKSVDRADRDDITEELFQLKNRWFPQLRAGENLAVTGSNPW